MFDFSFAKCLTQQKLEPLVLSLSCLLFAVFHTCFAEKRVSNMITGVTSENEFTIGESITISCSLNGLGGANSLPDAISEEDRERPNKAFNAELNGINRTAIARIPHDSTDGSEVELASFRAYLFNSSDHMQQYGDTFWNYDFDGPYGNNRSDVTDNAGNLSLTITIPEAMCEDQVDYICMIDYLNKEPNGGITEAKYHQRITAKAVSDPSVSLSADPDNINPPEYVIGKTVNFDCTFNGPSGMKLQWQLFSCATESNPKQNYTDTDEGTTQNNGPEPETPCVQQQYSLRLALKV